jgi:hypothetical protein
MDRQRYRKREIKREERDKTRAKKKGMIIQERDRRRKLI